MLHAFQLRYFEVKFALDITNESSDISHDPLGDMEPPKNHFFLNRYLFDDSILFSLCMLNDINQVYQRGTFETCSTENAKDIRENVENPSNSTTPLYLRGYKA